MLVEGADDSTSAGGRRGRAIRRAREAKVERENLLRETLGRRRSSRPPPSGVVLVAEMLAELTVTGS